MNDIIKRSENINEGLDLIVNEFRDIQHVKIPFNDIATLGSTFTPLVSSFKQNEQMFPGGYTEFHCQKVFRVHWQKRVMEVVFEGLLWEIMELRHMQCFTKLVALMSPPWLLITRRCFLSQQQ